MTEKKEICQNCKGRGCISYYTNTQWTGANIETCPNCKGKGYVEVSECENENFILVWKHPFRKEGK